VLLHALGRASNKGTAIMKSLFLLQHSISHHHSLIVTLCCRAGGQQGHSHHLHRAR